MLIALLLLVTVVEGQICPEEAGVLTRSESQKICDANALKSKYRGTGTEGMIRQITYKSGSCCQALQTTCVTYIVDADCNKDDQCNWKDSKCVDKDNVPVGGAIKEWKPDSCDKIGNYWIKHQCIDEKTMVKSQYKDAACTLPLKINDKQVKHTCGTECYQEGSFELSYDCSSYKKTKPPVQSATAPAPAPKTLNSDASIIKISAATFVAPLVFSTLFL